MTPATATMASRPPQVRSVCRDRRGQGGHVTGIRLGDGHGGARVRGHLLQLVAVTERVRARPGRAAQRSTAMTCQPPAASAATVAAPIPRAAPVTRATRGRGVTPPAPARDHRLRPRDGPTGPLSGSAASRALLSHRTTLPRQATRSASRPPSTASPSAAVAPAGSPSTPLGLTARTADARSAGISSAIGVVLPFRARLIRTDLRGERQHQRCLRPPGVRVEWTSRERTRARRVPPRAVALIARLTGRALPP